MQRGPEAAKEAFSLIPESVVRDMTAWLRCDRCQQTGAYNYVCTLDSALFLSVFNPRWRLCSIACSALAVASSHSAPSLAPSLPSCSFLIYNQSTELLGGMDIGVLVACLTGLLKHTHLVTSPPVHASIVQLLLAMLSPQVSGQGFRWHFWGSGRSTLESNLPEPPPLGSKAGMDKAAGFRMQPAANQPSWLTQPPPGLTAPLTQLDYRSIARGGALGPRRVSPAEAALVTAVLGTGAAQVSLSAKAAVLQCTADVVADKAGLSMWPPSHARPPLLCGSTSGCVRHPPLMNERRPTCCRH